MARFRSPPFTGSSSCAGRIHCATCRDLEGGRVWREKLTAAFKLPDGEIDFVCPHGVPWNPTSDQLPERAKAQSRPSRCPYITCANCSEPAHCRITGAEVDIDNCGDGSHCKLKK